MRVGPSRTTPGSVGLGVGSTLLLFGVCVLLSNGFDWDVFLGFNEVDRRAWVLDHRPPLWSYQLCAGITRVGDPQAFGLSPLFLLVVLFGAFFGTKLAMLVAAAVGIFFTTRLLALFADVDGEPRVPHAALLTLATVFVTSNYFVWHLLVGHFNFVSFFFGLGIIFYTLEGHRRGLGRRDFLLGTLVAWQHYSGGFFHSTVYLLAPFFIAFSLFIAATTLRGSPGVPLLRRPAWRRLGAAAGFHLCGVLLAAYKLVAVWQQQQLHPRVVGSASESNDLVQLLAYQLVPTLGTDWLIPFGASGDWDLHEYSAFSLFPFLAAALAVRLALRRSRAPAAAAARRHPLTGLVVLYALVSSLFVLGSFAAWAPFPLVNALLFQNSIRCVGRYGVGVTLSLVIVCVLLLRRLGATALRPGTCVLLLLLSMLNLASFSWMLSVPRTLELASLPVSAERRMSRLLEVPEPLVVLGRELDTASTSETYATLRAGVGVINCYNPLVRNSSGGWPPGSEHALIDDRHGAPDRSCSEESYFTQNEIAIGASCPAAVCLNVGALNPRAVPAGVRYVPGLRRFCRRPLR